MSRDKPSLRADCAHFFPLCCRRSASVSGNVFRLHCRLLVHPRDCPTHVLRLSRLRDGEYSKTRTWSAGASQPICALVPSSAKTWLHPRFASENQVRGRGSPRQPDTTSAVGSSAGADVPATQRAQGPRPRCSSACATQCLSQHRARAAGASRLGQ